MAGESDWDEAIVAAFKEILGEGLTYFETSTRMAAVLGGNAPIAPAALSRALEYLPVRRLDLQDPGARVYAPMIEFGGRRAGTGAGSSEGRSRLGLRRASYSASFRWSSLGFRTCCGCGATASGRSSTAERLRRRYASCAHIRRSTTSNAQTA